MTAEITRKEFKERFVRPEPIRVPTQPTEEELRLRKEQREAESKWHVVILPMSPLRYRAEIRPLEGGYSESPIFKTEQEAQDWVKANT